MEVAIDEGYISEEEFYNIQDLIAETARLLSGLQKSFQKES